MILTEEELKKQISYIRRNRSEIYEDIFLSIFNDIEDSYIELFKANASLSYKNMKYKETLIRIERVQTPSWYEDVNLMRTEATKTLEELNHDTTTANHS